MVTEANMEPSDHQHHLDNSTISDESAEDHFPDYYQTIDMKLFEKYYRNRSVSNTAFWSLIVFYLVLIIAGTLGNLFVLLAVIRNKSKFAFIP